MKIAVVDDDKFFLKNLINQVTSYPDWGGELPLILPFSSAVELLRYFEANPVDIVILDVVMPGLSGVEAARRIYELNPGVVLAFVSSSPDHAVADYGVDAVAHLLKPARRETVHALIRETAGFVGPGTMSPYSELSGPDDVLSVLQPADHADLRHSQPGPGRFLRADLEGYHQPIHEHSAGPQAEPVAAVADDVRSL